MRIRTELQKSWFWGEVKEREKRGKRTKGYPVKRPGMVSSFKQSEIEVAEGFLRSHA